MKILLAFLLPLSLFGKICFLHISKTGGTTIHSLLEEHFDASDFYPYRLIGESGIVLDSTPPLDEMPVPTQSVISGHFPIWWLKERGVNGSAFTFTVLRDPVERVISHYFFKLQYGYPSLGHPVHSPLDVVPNLMCRMLSSDPTLTGDALLDNAKANLANLDFIVFFDDFEGGVSRLFQKLGLKHEGPIPHLNKTKKESAVDIRDIQEMNDLDIKLYDYAKTHLRGKSI